MQPLTVFSNLYAPTQTLSPETITSIVNRTLGAVTVSPRFRLTDMSLNPIVQNLEGAVDAYDLSPLFGTDAKIDQDAEQAVQRKLSYSILDPLFMPEYNFPLPLNPNIHLVAVGMALLVPQQQVGFECPLGFYRIVEPSATMTDVRRRYTGTALDLTTQLSKNVLISDWVIPVGYTSAVTGISGYVGAMIDALITDPLPLSAGGTGATPQGNDDAGLGIPLKYINADLSGNQPVTVAQYYQAGRSRFDMVNDLASQIGYVNWYQDVVADGSLCGSLVLRTGPQRIYQTGALPSPGWDYSTTGGQGIIVGSVSQDFQATSDTRMGNVFKVESSQTGSDTATFSSLAVNQDADSAVSLANLRALGGGSWAISQYVQAKFPTQQYCDLQAQLLEQQGKNVPEKISFNSRYNPLHGSGDILTCQIEMRNGTVCVPSDAGHVFIETQWSLPLWVGSTMAHTLSRVVPLN